MHRRVSAMPRPAGRGGRTQPPRLGGCGKGKRRGNPLEVIRRVRRLDRQRIPFRNGTAEFARPRAIGAFTGGRLRGDVVPGMMRSLGRSVERPGRAGADHPANRHRQGQNRCQPRMFVFHDVPSIRLVRFAVKAYWVNRDCSMEINAPRRGAVAQGTVLRLNRAKAECLRWGCRGSKRGRDALEPTFVRSHSPGSRASCPRLESRSIEVPTPLGGGANAVLRFVLPSIRQIENWWIRMQPIEAIAFV